MSTTLGRGEEVDVIKTLLHLQLCQDVLRNLTNAKVLCELYSCVLHLIDQGGGKKKKSHDYSAASDWYCQKLYSSLSKIKYTFLVEIRILL